MDDDSVKAWSEQVSIPTYQIGAPNKNPMFLEKRIYQGSSGAVYPHPVIDQVFNENGWICNRVMNSVSKMRLPTNNYNIRIGIETGTKYFYPHITWINTAGL